MRVLILRAAEDAERTAREVAAHGHEPLILPTEMARRLDAPPPDEAFAAFAATSARAAPALAGYFAGDPRPVFAVGARTADAVREAGFPDVRAGEGDAEALAQRIAASLPPQGAPILYVAGIPRTGTLETALQGAGIGVCVWEVYETRRRGPERTEVAAALGAGPPDAVLVLSAGQAEALAELAAAFPDLLGRPTPWILSRRIAEALPPALRERSRISPDKRLASLFEGRD